jgi:hypothetical protein
MGSLLRSYELWVLDDDDIHRRFCVRLMAELPEGIDSRPRPPHPLYLGIRDLAGAQIELLDDIMDKQAAGRQSQTAQLRDFWSNTLPAALDQQFIGYESPLASNLRELERAWTAENGR